MLTEVGVDRVEVSGHTKAMFEQEIVDKAFDIVNKGGLMLSLGIHITCEAVYKRTQTPDELVQEQLREQQQQQLQQQQQQQQQQQHLDELDSYPQQLQQQYYDFVRYLQQRHPGYNQQLLDVYITEHTMRMSAVEASERLKMIPASRKAIDELEKIKFDGGGETSIINKVCNICLDEFEMGLEVTRLPCSHGFHGDCITKWLETSHFCPSRCQLMMISFKVLV
ncbi:hypothetical protein AQUCO_00200527v1 [Aquilegia coerulea]|uniref:RING-type domain-containing protein n=1 Tax=Aquilegia coerulea TaxID=218851 RepID=A0A2G5F3N0_AQUCA|nr:hypothetical protein AQUCO_00200527v1 [Aquilegia coerulea]